MVDPTEFVNIGVQYFQLFAIVLLGYCLYLHYNVVTKVKDSLEKAIVIFGLGFAPFIVILVILSIVPTETLENIVIDTTSFSLFVSSVYIIYHYRKKS